MNKTGYTLREKECEEGEIFNNYLKEMKGMTKKGLRENDKYFKISKEDPTYKYWKFLEKKGKEGNISNTKKYLLRKFSWNLKNFHTTYWPETHA